MSPLIMECLFSFYLMYAHFKSMHVVICIRVIYFVSHSLKLRRLKENNVLCIFKGTLLVMEETHG